MRHTRPIPAPTIARRLPRCLLLAKSGGSCVRDLTRGTRVRECAFSSSAARGSSAGQWPRQPSTAGHDVTLLHRGPVHDPVFDDAEHLHADRDKDLSVLAGREFDATVDVCAYVPRQVDTVAEALGGRGGHHVFVSTMSVYAEPTSPASARTPPCSGSTTRPPRRSPARPTAGSRCCARSRPSRRTGRPGSRSSVRRTSSGRTTTPAASPGGYAGSPAAVRCSRRAPRRPDAGDRRARPGRVDVKLARSGRRASSTASLRPRRSASATCSTRRSERSGRTTQPDLGRRPGLARRAGRDRQSLPLWTEGGIRGPLAGRPDQGERLPACLPPAHRDRSPTRGTGSRRTSPSWCQDGASPPSARLELLAAWAARLDQPLSVSFARAPMGGSGPPAPPRRSAFPRG